MKVQLRMFGRLAMAGLVCVTAVTKSGHIFQTTNLEYKERSNGNVPSQSGVRPAAVPGEPSSSSPISVGTAKLSSPLDSGTVAGADTAGNQNVIAGALQNTAKDSEGASRSATADTTTPGLVAHFGSLEKAMLDAWKTGRQTVGASYQGGEALNLGGSNPSRPSQNGGQAASRTPDQNPDPPIYRTPEGGATLMFLGIALCGMSCLRGKLV